jgi:hypothetical protein
LRRRVRDQDRRFRRSHQSERARELLRLLDKLVT